MNSKMIQLGIVAVVVAGAAFFGGYKYAQSKTPVSRFAGGNRMGAIGTAGGFRGANGMGGNGQIAGGQILSKTDNSITVKLPDGSSRIILFSGSTGISKSVDGSASDLVVGQNITASGTPNQDGSITAQQIQLRRPMPSPSPTSSK